MNECSMRVRGSCDEGYHENDGFFSTKTIFDGFRDSLFAIAVASCAGPKPMQIRSYVGDECAVGELEIGSREDVVCSVDAILESTIAVDCAEMNMFGALRWCRQYLETDDPSGKDFGSKQTPTLTKSLGSSVWSSEVPAKNYSERRMMPGTPLGSLTALH